MHPPLVDEQLNHCLSDLHLHTQQQESRSQMWTGSSPTYAKGCPPSPQTPVAEFPPLAPVQKQVWFNLGDDLGEAPSLPTDLAHFLGRNAALHPLASSTARSSQPLHDNGHPQHPIHTRGAQQKAAVKPMAAISGWTLALKDAQPSGSGWWLDLGANEMGRKTPPVVEGASSSLPGPYWYMTSVTFMPKSIPAGRPQPSGYPWPKWKHLDGGRPSQLECAMSLRLPVLSWFPWHEGLPCHQAGGNSSLGPRPSMCVQRGRRVFPGSFLRLHGTSKALNHGSPNAVGWRWDHGGFTVGLCLWQTHQLLTPITPRPGSGHTWRRGMNYQVGSGSFVPSAIEVPSPSARLKYKSWPASRWWLSGYQRPRMRITAGGMPCPALQTWVMVRFPPFAYQDSGARETSGWWGGMKPWDLGPTPPAVCCTIWDSSGSTLWSCPRPVQVSCASHGKG